MSNLEHYFLRLSLFIVLFIILLGCHDSGYSNKFGSPISNRKATAISALFDSPAEYDGKTVTIKGVIDDQDERGCWFYMKDDQARIYVDLYDAGFTIPNLTDKTVLAEGKIEVKLDIPSLLAAAVEPQQ